MPPIFWKLWRFSKKKCLVPNLKVAPRSLPCQLVCGVPRQFIVRNSVIVLQFSFCFLNACSSGVEAESFQYDNFVIPRYFSTNDSWFIYRISSWLMIHFFFVHDSWFISFLSMIHDSQPARWYDSWFLHFFSLFLAVIQDSASTPNVL